MISRRSVLLAAAAYAGSAHAQAQQRFSGAKRFSAEQGGQSFLVIRNGVVLAEDYPNGGAAGTPHPLRTASASFAALLAARLVRDDLLDLDEPCAFTLGEWGADAQRNSITVRQLLALTSGVAGPWDANRAPEWTEALAAPVTEAPELRFQPAAAPFQIFGEIARRKLFEAGLEPDVGLYLHNRVLAPLGADIRFTQGADGRTWLSTGMSATARAWGQVGELVRRGGIWRARSLVSRLALAQCFDGAQASHYRYGLGWWLGTTASGAPPRPIAEASDVWSLPSTPIDLAMAAGAGGQRLYVIPSRALVVVRQAQDGARPRAKGWSDAEFLNLILTEAA